MEKDKRLFRKAAFGGFNKEDVISYIEKMKKEFAEYKQQVEETVDALNARISDSEQPAFAAAQTKDEPAQEAFEVGSISEATERLKEVGDALCKNLNALIDKMQSAPAAAADGAGVQEEKGEKQEYSKDAALVESLLPAYLR